MKQRVYRGKCPYESLFKVELEGNCRNCDKYFECRKRERSRKRRAKQQRKRIMALIALVAITIGLVITAAMILKFFVFAMTKDNSSKSSESSSSVAIDNVQIITSASPMATPEIHVNVDANISVEVFESINPVGSSAPVAKPVISADKPGTVYYYELSYEDKVYIAKVVYAESRGEPYEGQVAVAAVILNRFFSDDGRFNRESIYTVVTQSGQFASIADVTMEDLESVESCMQAVEDACKGWDPTRAQFPNGAVFFYNPDGDLSEGARNAREGIETYQIGHHLFHIELN